MGYPAKQRVACERKTGSRGGGKTLARHLGGCLEMKVSRFDDE